MFLAINSKKKGYDMLNSIDAVNTIREAREGHLIELTTKAAEVALHPLDHGKDALCDLTREILNVAVQPIPGVA